MANGYLGIHYVSHRVILNKEVSFHNFSTISIDKDVQQWNCQDER